MSAEPGRNVEFSLGGASALDAGEIVQRMSPVVKCILPERRKKIPETAPGKRIRAFSALRAAADG